MYVIGLQNVLVECFESGTSLAVFMRACTKRASSHETTFACTRRIELTRKVGMKRRSRERLLRVRARFSALSVANGRSRLVIIE